MARRISRFLTFYKADNKSEIRLHVYEIKSSTKYMKEKTKKNKIFSINNVENANNKTSQNIRIN